MKDIMLGGIKNTNKIIAHRGYWLSKDEKNTQKAIERAFDNGFGVEIDLRDYVGNIVISHNMPIGNEITFKEVLEILDGRNLTLALNIKADGLADKIKDLLKKYSCTNYFTFDMSIPEMVYQQKIKLNVFTGLSDIVKTPILYEKSLGIWLDSYNLDWFGEYEIKELLCKKKVCVVSPDLHQREHISVWKKYKNIAYYDGFMICTDYPKEAMRYFYGEY